MFRCSRCGALNRVAGSHPEGAPVCGRCKEALDVSGAPQEVDAEGLARAIASSSVPVLVDFWAPWCGPCRAVAPVVEAVAKLHAGQLMALKVNTDANPEPSGRLGIRSIPTLIVFKGGAEVGRQIGALPRSEFERWLTPFLEAPPSAHA